jgi:hypothetical protein
MTSLGLLQYSEISDNSAINMSEIDKKKQNRHNITIKKRHDISTSSSGNSNSTSNGNSSTSNNDNVQNMLKLINNSNGYDSNDDDGTNLVDFNPPPRAQVSSKITEGMNQSSMNQTNTSSPNVAIDFEKPTTINQPPFDINSSENIAMAVKPRKYPAPMDSYEGFNTLPKTYASDYYKQYVPHFDQSGSREQPYMNKNQMLEKLNYMIHLLEEQKDEKTGHVMEEVILYSFLGVFIIFIVDSFARVGKYTR